MVGILIAGHGGFPSGVLSAVNLVAGNPGNVTAVDFVEGMSTDELKARMLAALDGMEQEEILVLTDLAGGTPFRTAAEIKAVYTGKRMRVVAGANMPAVVEAAFSSGDMDLDELTADVIQTGTEGFVDLDALGAGEEEVETAAFEDGI